MDKLEKAERKLAGCCINCGTDKNHFSQEHSTHRLFGWRRDMYSKSRIKDLCFQCWMKGEAIG